jgi:hypothetical protein
MIHFRPLLKLIKQIIIGYSQWIWYYVYKPYRDKRKTEAKRRIEICEKCDLFWHPGRNCTLCGCFMDVKTKMVFKLDDEGISIDGCLERKW